MGGGESPSRPLYLIAGECVLRKGALTDKDIYFIVEIVGRSVWCLF